MTTHRELSTNRRRFVAAGLASATTLGGVALLAACANGPAPAAAPPTAAPRSADQASSASAATPANGPTSGPVATAAAATPAGLIEPRAGTWKTWVLASGAQL